MKYTVKKTYVLEASSEKHAREILATLESKNLQDLFLLMTDSKEADEPRSIWRNLLP